MIGDTRWNSLLDYIGDKSVKNNFNWNEIENLSKKINDNLKLIEQYSEKIIKFKKILILKKLIY